MPVLIICLLICLMIFGPMITVWALNTLFGLSIPINLATWFAMLWVSGTLGAAARGAVSSSKD